MKHLLYISIVVLSFVTVTSSCGSSDNNWNDYKEWRNANYEWYLEQQQRTNDDGTPYYTQINPTYYPQSGVLIHYFNDRSETAGNLSPFESSTVKVKYVGQLYDGTVFDQTDEATTETRTFPLSGTITGWQIAVSDMHVGDTCQVVIPYPLAYGENGTSSVAPYSNLQFNIRLVEISGYQIQ